MAEWLTPKGRFINEIGIEPDVVVERTEEDYHAGRDPQLDKAVELLGGPSHHRPLRRNKPHLRTRREVSAGGIIVRSAKEGLKYFLFAIRLENMRFQKDIQKMGETLAETAVREIREETGLTGLRFVAPLGRIWLIFGRNKTVIHKTVHMFLFEAPLHAKEKFSGQRGLPEADGFRFRKFLKMREGIKILINC